MTKNEKWIMENKEMLSGDYINWEVDEERLSDMMYHFSQFVNDFMKEETGESKKYELSYHVELILDDVKEL